MSTGTKNRIATLLPLLALLPYQAAGAAQLVENVVANWRNVAPCGN